MGSNRNLKISATGFPLTNETLRFMQEAWKIPLQALSNIIGNKVILEGVVIVENNASAGYIAYNGVIYPFLSGEVDTNVTLKKNTINVEYDVDLDNDDNLDSLPAYETYHFEFGDDGIETFAFNELFRLKSLEDLSRLNIQNWVRKGENSISLGVGETDGFTINVNFDALSDNNYDVEGFFESSIGSFISPIAWITVTKTNNSFSIKGQRFGNSGTGEVIFKWKIIKN